MLKTCRVKDVQNEVKRMKSKQGTLTGRFVYGSFFRVRFVLLNPKPEAPRPQLTGFSFQVSGDVVLNDVFP